MTTASQRLAAFHRRVEEIEALHRAGEIGNETRRALLERARDQCGIGKGEFVNGRPRKSRATNDNAVTAAKRAGRKRFDYPVG